MSLPKPDVPLQNSCSTIYRNKLYTYSSAAFQVLPLTQDAEWKTLKNGVAVDGAVCVHAKPADGSPEALYIVGGKAGAADVTYQGLQKYIYSEDRWETIQLQDPVTQGRVNHNADYLPQHDAILLFSGSQNGDGIPSSETFTINIKEGYKVRSHPSEITPAISPLMIAWTSDQAATLGGTETNTRVMGFGLDVSWFDTGCTLPAPIVKKSEFVKAAMMIGDDNSKQLYLFDMSESPNKVSRITCVDGTGAPVDNLAKGSPPAKRQTSGSWPAYNETFAPTTTRQGYSLAQGPDGLVVLSGGNDAEPLTIFDMKENSWVNATARLGPQIVLEDESSSSTSSTSLASSTSTSATSSITSSTSPTATLATTPSATVTGEPEPAEEGFNFAVLGIVLGAIIGFGLLIVAVIFCIKRSRKRRGSPEDGGRGAEKEMDFADRGLNTAAAKRYPKRHEPSHSSASVSSTAILMGKVSSSPPQPALGRGHGSKGSNSSSAFNQSYKNAISKPIPQSGLAPSTSFSRPQQRPHVVGGGGPIMLPRKASNAGNQQQDETRRSSGWNRYWSGGSALNMMGFGNKRTTYGSQQSDRESVYSNDGGMPPKLNTSVPGISFGQSGRLSQVASGSPTIYQAKGYPLDQGMSGQIARANSVSSVSSYGDHRDEFSSGVPTSEESQKAWTPFGGSDWNNRAASSVYTDNSFNQPTPRGTLSTAAAKQQADSSDMSWLNLGR